MTNETTKPEVTQADRDMFASVYDDHAPKYAAGIRAGDADDTPLLSAFAKHRLASQAVVSQDLVEQIARALCLVDETDPDEMWEGSPVWDHYIDDAKAVFPIIEAAQIAARNEALDEAAKIAAERYAELIADECEKQAEAVWEVVEAIRSLRTPSQHQEEQ